MHSGRYTELIQPQNATLRKLLIELPRPNDSTISKRYCLERYLQFLRGFKYINASGITSLEETITARAGNCLSLICLLCSLLRSAGFADNEAFASIGCLKGFHLVRMHAYAIIKNLDQDDLLIVDPEVMNAKSVDYDHLGSNYSLFVVFNDQGQASDKQEIRSLLMSDRKMNGSVWHLRPRLPH